MVKSGLSLQISEAFRKVSDAVDEKAAPTELADSDNIKLTESRKPFSTLSK